MKYTIKNLMNLLNNKEISSLELTENFFNKISNSKSDAFLTLNYENALSKAKEIDEKRIKNINVGKLAGIPCGIKDNICTKNLKTTCASKMLYNFIPPYNATVIDKLLSEDAIILGKLNMDEFAMGSSCENSYFKITKNPHDLTRVPGGSSGGSAASVASGETVFSLGTDTGGSIRQPSSFCGVCGLKPTYGRVSRYGLIAYASSLDQIGPICNNVYDCGLILNIIAGKDDKDATSIESNDFLKNKEYDMKNVKIAIIKELMDNAQEDVKNKIIVAAKDYEKMGAKIYEISIPELEYLVSSYYIIASAEASSNLARFDGIKFGYCTDSFNSIDELYKKTRSEGFGKEVKKRIMLGTYVLSKGYYDEYYKKALRVRDEFKLKFEKYFLKFDAMLSPVAPTTAYKIGERKINSEEVYKEDMYTAFVNLIGAPAISVPCGTDKNNLPIGMQIIGKNYDEDGILKIAYAYEQMKEEV